MGIIELFLAIVTIVAFLLWHIGKYFIMAGKYFSLITQHIIEDKKVYKIFAFGRKSKLKKFYKECGYYRDVPNRGELSISYILLKDFDIWKTPDKNLINAMLIKMIIDKNLCIVDENDGSHSIKLISKPSDELYWNLYDILEYSAKDSILEIDELKNYVREHYEIYDDYIYTLKRAGNKKLEDINAYSYSYGVELSDLTEVGVNELREIYGMKKFLDDFTLIDIRGIKEINIWEYLLVYASLLGIADKFYKDNKEIVPINIDIINAVGRAMTWR